MAPGDRDMAAYAGAARDGVNVSAADLRDVERLGNIV
jgi:hypothetical protein